MAAPIQFRLFTSSPKSARLVADQRLEYAAGYLTPDDLGLNSVNLPGGSVVFSPPILSPGFSSFTGLFTDTAAFGVADVAVAVEILDPFDQSVVYGQTTAGGFNVAAITGGVGVVVFHFGVGGKFNPVDPLQSAAVWLLWRVRVEAADFPDGGPVTVELYANARMR